MIENSQIAMTLQLRGMRFRANNFFATSIKQPRCLTVQCTLACRPHVTLTKKEDRFSLKKAARCTIDFSSILSVKTSRRVFTTNTQFRFRDSLEIKYLKLGKGTELFISSGWKVFKNRAGVLQKKAWKF